MQKILSWDVFKNSLNGILILLLQLLKSKED